MSRFWSAVVSRLEPYVPGEQPKQQRLVKLNTNENPYPPSPKVIAAIQTAADEGLRLYPDPESTALREAIAGHYGLAPEQVFPGNGSDEVLAHVFQALLNHDTPLLHPDIGYSFYPVYARLYGVNTETVPLTEDFSIRVADYTRASGAVILANPNAPTGLLLSLGDIETLLRQDPDRLVVVDEAYIDFGGDSARALVPAHDNLLVVQTLSKSRALAGLRVGFALGQAELIDGLRRVKNSFNSYPLDRLAQAGAAAAIADDGYFQETRRKIVDARATLAGELEKRGFEVLPSSANFLFVRPSGEDAGELSRRLRDDGVIVRHFTAPERIRPWLRITVGTDEQHQSLLAAIDRGP
jgi:histidinol-phosphate aminotransferase